MDNQTHSDKLVLFTYFRSSTSWRVRIVLNLKQIPHDFHFVHLVKGQQKSEEFKKVNPNGVGFISFRPSPLCCCPMDRSSSSRWPFASTWRKLTPNIHYCQKTQYEERKSGPSVRLSTPACILTKT
jgi:hypothetical protein